MSIPSAIGSVCPICLLYTSEIALIAGSIGTHGGAVEHSIVEDARREVGPPKVAAGDRIALDNRCV